MTIVYAIIIFCLLVFVHEMGHFVVAKKSGVKVNEFALGMGPKLFSFTRGETKYSLRAIPIGGYCAMEGEDEDSSDPRAFNNKPAWKRALVLFAGSAMNIILAIVLMSVVIFYVGVAISTIDSVSESSPAAVAGIEAGDTILVMDGVEVEDWADVTAFTDGLNEDAADNHPVSSAATPPVEGNSSVELLLTLDRDGEVFDEELLLSPDEEGYYRMGVTAQRVHTPAYFFKSFGYGTKAIFQMTGMMYEAIGQLVTGRADMDQVSGPVGIVKAVGDSAKYGFIYLVQLTALISLNLGIMNLLPFPALDGGRLIFLLIRKVTGKKVTDSMEGKVHLAGMLVLFAFMIFITVHDIGNLL
ncbi:MAG: RIP metalloprotease RseP [Clostridiales Family XIII bacterium]|jgi:regulator of sigma E protease|nr:RIP metalloprotease RseP [Clostridiales Family XIII bacterium]